MNIEKKSIKVITPEEALDKFMTWFDKNKLLAFLITFFTGLITHITLITETIMSQDGLWNSMQYFRPGAWETTLGRWGIAIVERLNNFIAIPTVATFSCLFCIAVAAVLIVDMFKFKNKLSVILTSVMLAVVPTLTVTLLYIYTSFAYCFNFLISVLIIWLLLRKKHKVISSILATLLFTFSLSIYQSYIGVTIGLCAMISIISLIRDKSSLKEVFIFIGKTIVVVAIGGVLYVLLTNVILSLSNLNLSVSYKGTEEFSLMTILSSVPKTIAQTYKDFGEFFFGDEIIHNSNFRRELIYVVFFAMFVLAYIVAVVKMKFNDEDTKKVKIAKRILAVVFLLLLPVCLNIVDVLIVGNVMYSLTTMQLILFIPFAFAVFESVDKLAIAKWISILACFGIVLTYFIADHTSYQALKLTYNQAYSTTARIIDRIEMTGGNIKNQPLCIGGIVGNNNFPRTNSLYIYTVGSVVTNPTFHGSYSGALGTWKKFVQIFFGLDFAQCTDEEYQTIVTSQEYKDMKIFPDKDSVKLLNGIMVVKLSEDPDKPFKGR